MQVEQKILLNIAHTNLDSAEISHTKDLFHSEVDWDYLLDLAEEHKLIPLIHENFRLHFNDEVPLDIMEDIALDFRDNMIQNLLMTEELLRILDLLKAHGIKAFPFKGLISCIAIYGNLKLRQFSDLDILVHPDQFKTTIDLLKSHSQYQQLNAVSSVYTRTCVLVKHEKGHTYSIDLHQQLGGELFDIFPKKFEDISVNAQPLSVNGSMLYTFSPEDLLVYLCSHGCKDDWKRLAWISDIYELIKLHENLDWKTVVSKSHDLGSHRALLLGLCLTKRLLNIELPKEVDDKISDSRLINKLASKFSKRLFSQVDRSTKIKILLQPYYLRLLILERFEDKIASVIFVLSLAITPTHKDRDFLVLPQSISFLYPIVRFFRLTKYLP